MYFLFFLLPFLLNTTNLYALNPVHVACEFLDHEALEAVVRLGITRQPFPKKHAFYVLIETHGSNERFLWRILDFTI